MCEPGEMTKQAVRLGARIRAGSISSAALKKLHDAGILRSPKTITEGLERGNAQLVKKLKVENIPESSVLPFGSYSNRFVDHPRARLTSVGAVDTSHDPALTRRLSVIAGKPGSSSFMLQAPRADYRGVWSRGSTPNWRELAAVTTRHELDELRAALAIPKAARARIAEKMKFKEHMSPEVVAREGENLSLLSQKTQDAMKHVRMIEDKEIRALREISPSLVRGAYTKPPSVEPLRKLQDEKAIMSYLRRGKGLGRYHWPSSYPGPYEGPIPLPMEGKQAMLKKQAVNPYWALFGTAALAPLFAHALDPMSKIRAQRKLEAERVAKQLAAQNKTAEQKINDGLEQISQTLQAAKVRAAKKSGKGSPALTLKEDLV